MAITNFSELKTAIATWAARSNLSGVAGDFVTMTETIFNYGERDESGGYRVSPVRTRDMETTATVTVTDGQGDLPADFLGAIKVKDPGDTTRNIAYATPDWLDENFPTGQNGTYPAFYTIIGGKLLCPISVSLTYYAKIPTITGSDEATNWLLTKAPSAYLHGGLMQYSVYNKNPENVAYYRSLMVSALGGLGMTDMDSRAGDMAKRSGAGAW